MQIYRVMCIIFVLAVPTNAAPNEVICEVPVAPDHGSLHLIGDREVDSFALFSCDDGWNLVGASASKCLNNGRWTAPPPRCIAEKSISNGITSKSSVSSTTPVPPPTPERKATPEFIETHFNETEGTLTTANQTQEKECSCTYNSHDRTLSAKVNELRLRYGDKVKKGDKLTIRCYGEAKHLVLPNDTSISGSLTLTCDACQTWEDGVLPSCEDIRSDTICKELSETDLMTISYTDNLNVGSFANFHCFAPGIRFGVARAECLQNGEWSHSPPTCKKVESCIPPANPEHGRVSYSSLMKGSELRYECDNGFVLSQHKQRKCTEDGTWSNTEPVCTEAQCVRPANPKNGRVSYSSLKYGSELRYECDMGFVLSQHKQRKCTQDGTWSNGEPACNEISCEMPHSPEHGTVQLVFNRKVGSKAMYLCKEGRKIDGAHVSTCLSDGKWEFPPPKCVKDTCEMSVSPEHGTVQLSSYPPKENTIATYTCEEGRIMNGSSTSKCLLNGQWEFPPPKCVREGCDMPLSPEYGTVQLSRYPIKLDTRASYSCMEGRKMIGKSVSKCLIGGRWEFLPPKCVNVDVPK